jgi:hypothetical protein
MQEALNLQKVYPIIMYYSSNLALKQSYFGIVKLSNLFKSKSLREKAYKFTI